MKNETAEKQIGLSYLTPADTEWLEVLSGQQIPEASQPWLEYMDDLAVAGSESHKDSAKDRKHEILSSRLTFFAEFSQLRQPLESLQKQRMLPKPKMFIGTARLLYDRQIDILGVFNNYPLAMAFGSDNIKQKLQLLDKSGIDARAVINKDPRLIAFSTQTIPEKIEALESLGIVAARAINTHPFLLRLPPSTLKSRAKFFTGKSLDFQTLINNNPRILTFGTSNISRKLRVMYAAAKSWGIEDFTAEVNHVVEQWPSILTYKHTKLQVLARIASGTIEQKELDEISLSNVTNSVRSNLEAALAAYLLEGDDISRPQDIYRLSAKYKKLGSSVLKEIIRQHQSDSVVKVYLRGYSV